MAELFTLGYEGSTSQQFFKILKLRQITTLIDVRDLPISRKPGFSKSSLAEACIRSEIQYEHWPELGCPKDIRYDYREDGDWDKYTIRFKKHLRSLADPLEQLCSKILKENVCLVCFEADPNFCHRKYIAEAAHKLMPNSMEIIHLTKQGLTVAVR